MLSPMTNDRTDSPAVVGGAEGYAEDAEWLIPRYERVDSLEKFRAVIHLFPEKPGTILDLGAGTGADAGWLVRKGHRVVAVEPVAAFREAGRRLHPSPGIEWLDDSLPWLPKLQPDKQGFDLALGSAVWNHLAPPEQEQAMSRLAALLAPGRHLILSLRHGACPARRRMFEVCADETIRLAAAHRFRLVVNAQTASVQPLNRQAGVTWAWLAFELGSSRGHAR